LGDLPVLTIEATKVTTRCGQGINACSGEKMKQGLLLYGIHADGTGIPVSKAVQLSLNVDSRAANTVFPCMNPAIVRTKMTSNHVPGKLFLITSQLAPFTSFNYFH